MAQALYLKWRPQAWDDVVGQEHVTRTLRNAIASGRVHHAYLFAGPRGCGKTTTARIVAKAVNCLDPEPARRPCNTCAYCVAVNEGRFLDLIEIDGASNNSVEDVRDLRDKINFSPNEGRYKIYIIDEVHMLSAGAFNALLKTLEEPPPHAIFILATTEVHKVPATVLSRCQRHEFRLISQSEIVTRLKALAAEEGLRAEEGALQLAARHATGSLRDAISLLDQLAASGDEVTLARAQEALGAAASQAVQDLVEALAEGEPAHGLALINQTVDAGTDPRQLARQMVDYVRGLLLIRMGSEALVEGTGEARTAMRRQAERFHPGDLLKAARAFNQAATEIRSGWQPQLPLEMAFLESLLPPSHPGEALQETEPGGEAGRAVAGPSRLVSGQAEPGFSTAYRQAGPSLESGGGDPVESQPKSAREETKPHTAAAMAVARGPGETTLFGQVLASWRSIAAAARKHNPQTTGLLNSCTPLGLEEGPTLILGFASEVLQAKMEKGEHLANLRSALSEVLGQELQVQCVLVHRERSGGKAVVDLPDEGMAATALRELGAQVVDIQ